ncbi:MAG: DNA polymerase III subunit delta' [Parcubacteria group bacterium Greene0714_21]|nr:MAG: DNA polymerase III subunit delta' [Parcubacteria group bacterium Greene0416_39]TSC97736.1 MAG: DNA polymerase III subunit delta' [Parcubacteria group bacterium Greene1014_47]TSD04341.1 MAG: DNA polymerase III subunit delta' [Parcubacteria group bacterium Greene0714_21]
MTNLDYLVSSAKLGTLAHAYLLFGNDKKGKDKTIFAFCEFLLGSGTHHGDLHIIDSLGKEITISQIRDLELVLALGAWNSPWKIAVVRKAHLMNLQAQSAFLKLLEEPKGSTVFLLETDHALALLPTIRSRVQEIRFWKFPAIAEQVSAEVQKKFGDLAVQPLYKRFLFAKTLYESPGEIQQFLEEFIAYLRQGLPSNLRLVKLAQETSALLQTTNVSARLALERLFLYATDKV